MLSSITKDVSKPLYLQIKSLGIRILLPIKDSTSERTALRLLLQESAINRRLKLNSTNTPNKQSLFNLIIKLLYLKEYEHSTG